MQCSISLIKESTQYTLSSKMFISVTLVAHSQKCKDSI
jgi:hypothetical protein